MNILILNWRDIKNPFAGGAERMTQEYAAHWATQGHRVFWLANSHPMLPSVSIETGVVIKRIGPHLPFNVILLALVYPVFLARVIFSALTLVRREKIDLVIDEIHGLPFFTPLYIKTRTVLLVCEVAGHIWDRMYPFPFNILGKFLEKVVYALYTGKEIWAISQSTRRDILNINPRLQVKVLPLGIHPPPRIRAKKFPFPSAVFLARLVRMKGLESAINAAREISLQLPDFRLYVIGRGNPEYLKSLAAPPCVKFLGVLSEKDKFTYLSRSHFLFHPSYKEGFGLTVIEAGMVGTPTIARSGSSLDELIQHKSTGLIFDRDQQICPLFISGLKSQTYTRLATACRKYTSDFNWASQLKKSVAVTLIG